MTHPSHVALDHLKIDEGNIRKSSVGAEQVYVATIAEHGVIEPLIVRPNGGAGYLVMQGGKRLASLLAMKDKGLSARGVMVTGDYPVPVLIRDDVKTAADAREISLVTAICHMPVHPVDQFEAFAALADKKGGGLAVDEIARRFGQPNRLIEQRLALGRLSPSIRDAFRDGAIGVEIAQAFTLAADHKQQDRVFEAMRGELRWGNGASRVKQAIAGKNGQLGGAELIFVGAETYEKAGGKVTVDLFNLAESIVSEPALLKKLAEERIGAVCADLVVNRGWKWARPDSEIKDRWRYGGLNKKGKPTEEEATEIARLTKLLAALEDGDDAAALKLGATSDQLEGDDDDLREEIERLTNAAESRAFTDKDKTKAGCTVGITQKGKLLITYGLIEPERESRSSSSAGATNSRSSAKAEPAKKAPAAISNALKREIVHWLAAATQAAVAADAYKDPRAVLLAKLVAGQIDARGGNAYAPANPFSDKEMAALRDQATPAVVKAAMAKAFDADRYFKGIPGAFRLRALNEMGHDGAAPKKAAEAIGVCKKLAASTSWLPSELRWSHYDGPAGKAKPAAKAKAKAPRQKKAA